MGKWALIISDFKNSGGFVVFFPFHHIVQEL